jgi:hypothetical protein
MTNNNNEATIALQNENALLRAKLAKIDQDAQDAQAAQDKIVAAKQQEQQAQNNLRTPPKVMNKLIQSQKPSTGYTPPKPEDEAMARKVVGRDSDARLANNMSHQNPKEYARLRQIGVDLGLIA